MKATAVAHPIQGLVKYHGMRDDELRFPYHDSISVCTAPSRTVTTVEFDPSLEDDHYVVDGERVTGRGAERIRSVVDCVRERAGGSCTDAPVRLESENTFPTNIGFGSSSSGFAAAAMALSRAANLSTDTKQVSQIARRGSASAARSVAGSFSTLYGGASDDDCFAEQTPHAEELAEDTRIVSAMIPAYKETEDAHREAEESHMFDARLAQVHDQLAEVRAALREGDFDTAFHVAEKDSLSLAATTMTGPSAWIYWKPRTLEVFEMVRALRVKEEVPVYFSTDTGASVYVNTTSDYVSRVVEGIESLGDIETRVWEVGGPAHLQEADLF